jgi:hypothetical protein
MLRCLDALLIQCLPYLPCLPLLLPQVPRPSSPLLRPRPEWRNNLTYGAGWSMLMSTSTSWSMVMSHCLVVQLSHCLIHHAKVLRIDAAHLPPIHSSSIHRLPFHPPCHIAHHYLLPSPAPPPLSPLAVWRVSLRPTVFRPA